MIASHKDEHVKPKLQRLSYFFVAFVKIQLQINKSDIEVNQNWDLNNI